MDDDNKHQTPESETAHSSSLCILLPFYSAFYYFEQKAKTCVLELASLAPKNVGELQKAQMDAAHTVGFHHS